jgi:retron-type reverse transcriptase
MKTYKKIYETLCSKENLALAFRKASKNKSKKTYVMEFRLNLENNLEILRQELLNGIYKPKPLKTFIIKEPKTRKIRKSFFVDRIVHHAICNVLEPIFEKRFIFDSYANRKGKGSLQAVKRFEFFRNKVSKNNSRNCFVLKADIKHYFDTVNHSILINVLKKKIKDEEIINLVDKVLKNHSGFVGMPLGNMTSQVFANIYLNELDQFVKHKLKAKYYIRYVDDFVILHENKVILEEYKRKIDIFLKKELELELHKTKSKISSINQGINFLGFRIFPHNKLLRKSNIYNLKKKINELEYDLLCNYLSGWIAFAKQANTHNLRKKVIKIIDSKFIEKISFIEIDKNIKYAEVQR